jgi:NAD(P)-dependent dehydrogenase (short-subunit alcohol dehydrogenase family)
VLAAPRHGAARDMLLRNLVEAQTELINVPGKSPSVTDRFTNYIAWVANSVRLLRLQVKKADLEPLLLTQRYWTLQAMVTSPTGMAGDFVDAELADRVTAHPHGSRRRRRRTIDPSQHPPSRLAEPEEMAAAVAVLASADRSHLDSKRETKGP